jgi:hypothetical protein
MELAAVPAQIKDMWVVEWSHAKQEFYIEKVAHMMLTNVEDMAKRMPVDYFPVAFCMTMAHANKVLEQAEALQRQTPRYVDPTA